MLVILSPSAVTSPHVMDEVTFAFDEKKAVIPVLYRDCKVPLQLRSLHRVDFNTDYARGLKALLRALGVEQQAAAAEATVSPVPKESQADLSDANERKRAAEQTLEERRRRAEQARLEKEKREREDAATRARLEKERERVVEEQSLTEQERKQAALDRERMRAWEQTRLEQGRKKAATAEQARLDREPKKAAAEQARLDREPRKAEGWARLEQEHKRVAEEARLELRKAAGQARLEDERKQAAKRSPLVFSQFPAWVKVAVPLCGILIVALVLYWALRRPPSTQQRAEIPKQQAQAEPSNPQASDANVANSAANPPQKATPPPAKTAKVPGATEGAHAAAERSRLKPQGTQTDNEESAVHNAIPGGEELRNANDASDSTAVATWLWKTTAKGNADAPVRLANMYIKGEGVPRSCDQALVLLRTAALKGNAQADDRLASMYASGTCVQPNRVEAYRWWSAALAADPKSTSAQKERDLMWQQMTSEEREAAQRYR